MYSYPNVWLILTHVFSPTPLPQHTQINNKNFKQKIGTAIPKTTLNKVSKEDETTAVPNKESPPAPIRITLASLEEYNLLLQNGLDFYGATFFPTEVTLPNLSSAKIYTKRGRWAESLIGANEKFGIS